MPRCTPFNTRVTKVSLCSVWKSVTYVVKFSISSHTHRYTFRVTVKQIELKEQLYYIRRNSAKSWSTKYQNRLKMKHKHQAYLRLDTKHFSSETLGSTGCRYMKFHNSSSKHLVPTLVSQLYRTDHASMLVAFVWYSKGSFIWQFFF